MFIFDDKLYYMLNETQKEIRPMSWLKSLLSEVYTNTKKEWGMSDTTQATTLSTTGTTTPVTTADNNIVTNTPATVQSTTDTIATTSLFSTQATNTVTVAATGTIIQPLQVDATGNNPSAPTTTIISATVPVVSTVISTKVPNKTFAEISNEYETAINDLEAFMASPKIKFIEEFIAKEVEAVKLRAEAAYVARFVEKRNIIVGIENRLNEAKHYISDKFHKLIAAL